MDTLAIFDRVLVPHERIFMLGDPAAVQRWMEMSRFHTHVSHQVLARIIAKSEFVFGTLEQMIETFGSATYSHVVEKAAEVIAIVETLKALMLAAEAGAKKDRFGIMLPNPDAMYSANFLFPRLYPRMVEILQLVGGGSLVMTPGEKEFASVNRDLLETYLKANDRSAQRKAALLRLAWEIGASSFGGRQTLYERFFIGEPTRVSGRLYDHYSMRETYKTRVQAFLDGD
jgi:4-hydroxyphenylacetate 3-monooxygenase